MLGGRDVHSWYVRVFSADLCRMVQLGGDLGLGAAEGRLPACTE